MKDLIVKNSVIKESLSINIRRDMLVINMAIYLLDERSSEDTLRNDTLLKFSNNSHKVNKKINTVSKELLSNLQKTLSNLYLLAANKSMVIKWCDGFWMSKEVETLFHSIKETNLEALANQLLFVNFCARDKPVHKEMGWLCDIKFHDNYYDLIEKTDARNILGSVYDDALRCVKVLKGS